MKDIKEILKFLRELPKMIGMLNMPTEKVDIVQSIREIVYEWKGYKDLENQGKLLELEDKYQKIMIGQQIFVVEDNTVKPRKICKINEWWNDCQGFQGEYAAIPSKGFGSWEFKYGDFGKTVFLIKEEAETALREMSK